MFVQVTNFDKIPYQIPNLDQVVNSFTDWINEAEEGILRELLGNPVYDEFITALAAMPNVYDVAMSYDTGNQVTSANDIWESLTDGNMGNELIEGVSWTLIEQDNKWLELKNGALYDEFKWVGMVKMLTPFLYSEYLAISFQNRTSLGMVLANAENSLVINPAIEIVKSWNDFRRIVGSIFETENTLYGFMQTSDDYTGWKFRNPGYKNIFGL